MSSTSPDAAFAKIYKQFAGLGGDLRFVDAFFAYLRRNTPLLDQAASIAEVQKLAIKHCEIAKKEKQNSSPSSSSAAAKSSSQSQPAATLKPSASSPSSSPSTTASPSASISAPTAASSTDEPDSPTDTGASQSKGAVPVNNGGTTDRYTWSQSLSDVTMTLTPPLPATVTAKQLSVTIDTIAISITNKATGATMLAGTLFNRVYSDDATWTLEVDSKDSSKKYLSVYLPKQDRMQWWPSVLVGDPAIDVTKIVPENSSLNDLDRDTRATVEKMMFDQRAKQSGTASSDELTKEAALKKFMAAHPEMDFSQAKIM